jgi:hypothetical protein
LLCLPFKFRPLKVKSPFPLNYWRVLFCIPSQRGSIHKKISGLEKKQRKFHNTPYAPPHHNKMLNTLYI